MAQVKFIACTSGQFAALAAKDEGTLYFLSDAREIYKGDTPYGGGFYKAVAAFPSAAEAQIHTLYLNTSTGEVKFYDGTSFVTLVDPKATALSADSTHAEVPTAKAVVDFVSDKVTTDITVLEEKVTANAGNISTLQGQMAIVQGNDSTEGSIAKAEADAKEYANELVGALSTTVNGKADKADTLAGYGIGDAYTKTQVDTAIETAVANAHHLKREIVDVLPDVSKANVDTIYMVPKTSGVAGNEDGNSYVEYMLINGVFEQIGDSTVDLTDYATKSVVDDKIAEKVGDIGASTVKSYVDNAASTAQANAEATAAADATSKASAALSSAKSYADTQDAATLAAAKEYSDGLAGNYATAAQGAKADSALQKADIATGATAGTIEVKGSEVAVAGLGSAAFVATTAFDAAGAAASALTQAKAYSDGNLATAKSYAEDKANDALAAAKEYTDNALTWGTL